MVINGVEFPADPEQGCWVNYKNTADAPTEFEHIFCGPQDIPGAQCPCCHRPFVRYLALDTRDARLNLQDSPFAQLPLLDCPRCMVEDGSPAHHSEAFLYRARADGGIDIVEYVLEGRLVKDDFPYENYPPFLPGAKAVLQALTPTEQAALLRINHRCEYESIPPEVWDAMSEAEQEELTDEDWWYEEPYESLFEIRHQVGGEPYHIQGLVVLNCPDCGVQMPFLACIADDCLDSRGIVGYESNAIIFHFCRRCHIVGTYSRCG